MRMRNFRISYSYLYVFTRVHIVQKQIDVISYGVASLMEQLPGTLLS